jgi:hypothetical protein
MSVFFIRKKCVKENKKLRRVAYKRKGKMSKEIYPKYPIPNKIPNPNFKRTFLIFEYLSLKYLTFFWELEIHLTFELEHWTFLAF